MNAEQMVLTIKDSEEGKIPRCIPLFPMHPKREYRVNNLQFDSEESRKQEEENAAKKIGMDEFPEDIHSMMLEYLLSNGKFRDALLLVCAANLGMRFSDVVKLKPSHFLFSNGEFRTQFYLKERKTGKERPFFINESVQAAMCLFCEHSQGRMYEGYLFTSESNNKAFINGAAKPISHTAEENIIKTTLSKLGIKLKNDSRYDGGEIKLNTHSLRKMYGGVFCRTGIRLRDEGKLNIDLAVILLLQNDFMHKSMATTQRYCEEMERAKQIIVNEMNIGLPVLRKFL